LVSIALPAFAMKIQRVEVGKTFFSQNARE